MAYPKELITPSMILISLFTLFMIGAVFGYLCEVLFRRFVSAKKWVNPGFMHGPWLPIYGFGIVLMMTIAISFTASLSSEWDFYNPFGYLPFEDNEPCGGTVYDLLPILLIFASLQLLEFIAGLIFVKGFKVKLWDYSNMKFNYKGIVCPQFALVWFIVSVVYYYALNPFVYKMFVSLCEFMFQGNDSNTNFLIIFLLGITYGVFFVDLVSSLGLFRKIVVLAKKSPILLRYETYKKERAEFLKESKEKFTEKYIPENVLKDIEEIKARQEKRKNKFIYQLRKIVLIDPDKNNKENYGEDNRPKKEQ